MENNLLFDFSVNKENNSIVVTREFNAKLNLVWDAWTRAEILDQWWAPKPYKATTKFLDLKSGGNWLYAMVGPDGDQHWCRADYKNIDTQKLVSWLDTFCDENGNENNGKPRSFWINIFNETNDRTIVNITIQHQNIEEIETMLKMGFKEGFTLGLKNLDEYLELENERNN